MNMGEREKKNAAGSLNLEPRQHKAIKKEYESVTTGLFKGFLYLIVVAALYYFIFTHSQKLLDFLTIKTYWSALGVMALTVLVSYLFGTGINKLIKNTLERALESQRLREE
jgi:hypothetical protein